MPEHELWLTALFNRYLAGVANSILALFNLKAQDPAHPWPNWMAMELFVVAIIILLTLILRARLSVEHPGKLQHLFEEMYLFIKSQAKDVGIEHPEKYSAYFGTLFVFILLMNLLGIIPSFAAPTMYIYVTAGLALATFAYYNFQGILANGFGYLKQFLGPVWWLAPLMILIEIVSHLARPLSLSVRLFGNMFAGEQVTTVFIALTRVVVPVAFMALHVFVCFIQTYVFTLLAMIYVSGATSHEH